MDIKTQLGFIGLGATFLEYVFYIRSIVARKIKPHSFSWFIISVCLIVVTVAQIIMQAGMGAWVTGISAYFSLLICLIALLYGDKNITTRDKTTLLLCLGGIAVWIITGKYLSTLILIGGAYTLVIAQSANEPLNDESYLETLFIWFMGDLKWILSLVVCAEISWATAIFPALNIINMTILIVGVLAIRQSRKKPKTVVTPEKGLIVRYKRKDGRSESEIPKNPMTSEKP